jgi:hypothetical protein
MIIHRRDALQAKPLVSTKVCDPLWPLRRAIASLTYTDGRDGRLGGWARERIEG